MTERKIAFVTGATGRQGGAVVRHLLNSDWSVRALTRDPKKRKAIKLKKLGADVIKGDLDKAKHLRLFFEDADAVFSVQNPWITGLEKEVIHGKKIAEMAANMGVGHLVYSSAGSGKPGTGVPHFESKLQIERYIKELGISYTILRPAGFMELMTDKEFVPPLVAWNVTGKMLGNNFPLTWIACDDIGAITAKILENPGKYAGKEFSIAGDKKSMAECKEIYRTVYDKIPFRIPAPVWLFKWMQKDLYQMYQWMKNDLIPDDLIEDTRAIHPGIMNIEAWMKKKKFTKTS